MDADPFAALGIADLAPKGAGSYSGGAPMPATVVPSGNAPVQLPEVQVIARRPGSDEKQGKTISNVDPFDALGIDKKETFTPSPPPAAIPAGAKTGTAANVAAGVVEGSSGLANMLTDPFGNLIGKPLATGVVFAHDALAPLLGYKRFPDDVREQLLGDTVPQPGTRAANAFGSAIGAPSLENVVPANKSQEVLRQAAGGAAGLAPLIPGGVGAKLLGAATGALAAPAGTEAAGDVAPWAAPAVNLATQGVVGAGTLGAAAAARGLVGRPVAAAVKHFTQPLGPDGRTDLAAAQLRGAATDPAAAAAAIDANSTPLVPGSNPTTFQVSGDQGLGNLERAVAKNAPDQFLGRANEQNAARVGALEGVAPAGANADAAVTLFRKNLADLDAGNAASEAAALAKAQGATNALGGAIPAGADAQETALQGYGNAIRQPLVAAREAAGEAEGRLWNAIDPDKKLALDVSPVQQAAKGVQKGLTAESTPMDAETSRIFGVASMWPKVLPFQRLKDFRTQLTNAIPELRQSNAPGSRTNVERLKTLLDAVHASMEGIVAKEAETPAGHAIVDRLQEWATDAERRAGEATARAGGGVGVGGVAGSGAPPGAGVFPAARSAGGGSGGAAGSQGVSRGPKPQSLLSFLISKGGIREESGELRAVDAIKARPGLVNNRSGLSHDYAREAANEAHFGPFDDTAAFRAAVQEEALGRKVYRPHEAAEADLLAKSGREERANEVALEGARNRILRAEDDEGLRLTPVEVDHATALHNGGLTPREAIEQAGRASEYEALDRDAQRQAFSGGGLPAGARQAEMPVSGAPLVPNWDAAAAARYAAARAATRTKNETFREAEGVGAALKPGRFAGELDLPASRVPSTILSGTAQAEKVQNFLRAGGNRQALLDYAAFDLRRTAEKADGTLDPSKAATWVARHNEAATVLPELRTMGATAVKEAEAHTAIAAQRVAEKAAFEKSVAGRFVGEADPAKTIGRVLSSDVAQADMARLAKLTAGSPAARAGLQRAVVDNMMERIKSNAAAGTTGTDALKSDTFQTWLRQRESALRQIFSPEQIETMRAVAADLKRANKSISGTKLPGGSNTAQDLAAGAKHTHGSPTMLAQMIGAEIVGSMAHAGAEAVLPGAGFLAHAIGTGASIGSLVINAMRQRGLTKVDDMVTEAMLNPGLAKTLLMRPTPQAAPSVLAILKRQLQSLAMSSAVQSAPRPNKEQRR